MATPSVCITNTSQKMNNREIMTILRLLPWPTLVKFVDFNTGHHNQQKIKERKREYSKRLDNLENLK